MAVRFKEREKEIKRKDPELADEKEKVEILKKSREACFASHHLCNHKNEMRAKTIYANRELHSVRKMCEALKISQCQYYQWIRFQGNREKRKNREIWLVEAIRRIFIDNREVYGCRKIKKALETDGIFVSEWKIRRIMRENGFYPQTRKKWKPYRKAKSDGLYSENKVKRHFLPDRFNELWAGDITYIPTNMGWVYLAPFRASERIRPWI